jgi:hypothetical protein
MEAAVTDTCCSPSRRTTSRSRARSASLTFGSFTSFTPQRRVGRPTRAARPDSSRKHERTQNVRLATRVLETIGRQRAVQQVQDVLEENT